MKKLLIITITLLFTTLLSACRQSTYEIEFDTRSEDSIDSLVVERGETIQLPIPEKEANNFIGWYDISTRELFTSGDTVESDMVLFAKYESKETVDYIDYLDATNPVVTIEVRDYGVMQLELFPEVAPNTVHNFINLIQEGYYDGLTFHRIIEDFMIQGGRGENTNCSIEGEFNYNGFDNPLSHTRGVISMARTQIYDSASTQFFIVHEDSIFLNNQYASFGGLIGGFTVLDAIALADTNSQDAPDDLITITIVTVDTKGIDYDEPTCMP